MTTQIPIDYALYAIMAVLLARLAWLLARQYRGRRNG
jgi:hypothetical protein